MKGRKRAVVYSKTCTTKAAVREEIDLNHVCLVATINLLAQRLKPLSLITNQVTIKDPDRQMMSSGLAQYQKPKRYQDGLSTEFYVGEVLGPYCESLRNALHDPALPVFPSMDKCSSHNRAELLSLSADYNVYVIWLPRRSSHFLQPLDLGLLRELRVRY
jgi:hypothetical protein